MNIDNSKKSTKPSTKLCNSKKTWYTMKCFAKCVFFFTNLSQGNFLYCRRFFIPTKNLNTEHTPTEMKANLLH